MVSFISEMRKWFNIYKSINVIHCMNKLKNRYYNNNLIKSRKSLWGGKLSFLHDKSPGESINTGDLYQHDKGSI